MRGEYSTSLSEEILKLGTTSACAENTPRLPHSSQCAWNYLRVRGEYCHDAKSPTAMMELPPRARRILGDPATSTFGRGTTSACAENTVLTGAQLLRKRNYLRVRGEY